MTAMKTRATMRTQRRTAAALRQKRKSSMTALRRIHCPARRKASFRPLVKGASASQYNKTAKTMGTSQKLKLKLDRTQSSTRSVCSSKRRDHGKGRDSGLRSGKVLKAEVRMSVYPASVHEAQARAQALILLSWSCIVISRRPQLHRQLQAADRSQGRPTKGRTETRAPRLQHNRVPQMPR